MLYINDPKQPHYKYSDLVGIAIKSGVEPQRAYIYLASLGVKGALARIQSADSLDYLQPVKVAVRDNKIINKIDVCEKCRSLIIG